MADRTGTLAVLALTVAGAIAVPVVFGSLYATWRQSVAPPLPPVAVAPPPVSPAPAVEPELSAELPSPVWPREVDGVVFGVLEGILTEATEARDVAAGSPFRIDLLRPPDSEKVDRIRVDLDRDGRWDEHWTIAAGRIEREVSPADDATPTERWRWQKGAWVRVDRAGGP